MKVGSNIIGHGDHMNISIGQLRRLTIGVELVNRPSLIFLDEPTSGLDSYLASTVVTGLKNLAAQGHTIVCTIHQPSCDIFYGFSKLLLMSSGMPVYFGDTQTCIAYFVERLHCEVPSSSVNPAEFVVDIAAAAAAAASTSGSDHPTTAQLCEMLFSTWDPTDKELIDARYDKVRRCCCCFVA
jgi:ABC-type multidrug transport system ATPase subunit